MCKIPNKVKPIKKRQIRTRLSAAIVRGGRRGSNLFAPLHFSHKEPEGSALPWAKDRPMPITSVLHAEGGKVQVEMALLRSATGATAILLMVLLLAACTSNGDIDGGGGEGTTADSTTAEGEVVDFVADREVESLTIETADGQVLTFSIGKDVPAFLWDKRHLNGHQSSGQRLIVTFFEQDGALVATKLEEGGF